MKTNNDLKPFLTLRLSLLQLMTGLCIAGIVLTGLIHHFVA